MENVETASASAGPRYAAADPSIPKHWKVLMEKPVAASPPVPSVVPHMDIATQSIVHQVPQHGQTAADTLIVSTTIHESVGSVARTVLGSFYWANG